MVDFRWERLLQDPEQIKVRKDRAISEVATKDPTPWVGKIAELDRLESGYYDLAATGDMPKTVLREKLAALNEERDFARQQINDSEARKSREDSLRATRDTLLSFYRDGLLYDGLSHFDDKIRREIYEALSVSGILYADDVLLKTEVTDHALRLTKAAQEWAEEQREHWGKFPLSNGTPIGTVATTYNAVLRRPSAGERDTGENWGDIDTVAGRCTPLRDRRHTHRAEVPLA